MVEEAPKVIKRGAAPLHKSRRGLTISVNLANALSFFRILLIPVFMAFVSAEAPGGDVIAAAIFALAAFTDTLDGYYARKRRSITVLGKFLDPVADKLLISAALIALVELGSLPAWMATLIISREFVVSGLRLIAVEQGVVMEASLLGKLKTISQVTAVFVLLLPPSPLFLGHILGEWLMYLALLLTMVSAIDYVMKILRLGAAHEERS